MKPRTTIIGKSALTDKSDVYDDTYVVSLLFDHPVKATPRYAYNSIEFMTPDDYRLNIPISTITRGGIFRGNTSQAVVISFDNSGGCVRLLDSFYADTPTNIKDINNLVPISNLNQIVSSNSPTSPNPAIFGSEPSHSWCYYFERADLTRQIGDWQRVLQIGSEAESKGLKPLMGAEYIPFIEANAQSGNWPKAFDLSQNALKLTPKLETTLCNDWNQFHTITSGSDRDTFFARARTQFCIATSP